MSKTKEQKPQAEILKVKIIDVEKMCADIYERVKDTASEKDFIGVRLYSKKLALIQHEGRVAIIDDECIGQVWEPNKANHDFKSGVYKIYPKKPDGSGFIAAMPTWENSETLADMQQYVTETEMTLAEFMGERYGYNTRICCNTGSLVGFLLSGERQNA